ncbi:putative ATPase [Carboxydocella sporoproducens DSM 16521]|uniref:Replication-associated recombination protein A n=2 Tax=Carboxydocella TaxID=178898 RepID=A0A1T4PTH1_9FIRM|nr:MULTISPECIES: replication-associated recombination protein A [Carboxydocella]AVX19676.1 putative ATPase [Carboxydocella thermautotrophica]AVX30081.1 putative ATPase [Carboxydocella thermautotrophica]SJZ94208.1 putative ATPase [Carboxydocella sporoproducens DSM 16521]
MNLFEQANLTGRGKMAPLADRMRPRTLEEFVGQEEIVGPGRLLRRAIEADQLSSMIFYGPPGTGKTALAKVIANQTRAVFTQLNAVTSGVSELRQVTTAAKERLLYEQKRTLLFIDEIHRFNKSQQDALLPFVEDGTIILIGATTENPYFEVNKALLSRSRVFQFRPLTEQHILELLRRALDDEERGLAGYRPEVTEEALRHLARMANGDARTALNALELAVLTTPPQEDGRRLVDLAVAEESIQRPALLYDKSGDQHYDVISAFIKSMRGSDPDATLHYLARMLEAGEEPEYIARRIIVHAAEDVGLADPQALVVAVAAAQAVERIGMPEGRLPLAQAALYVALAPKENRIIKAIDAALADVRAGKGGPVPLHLRDTHYAGARDLGHGQGYKYPHNYPGARVEQQYLPDDLRGRQYWPRQEKKDE